MRDASGDAEQSPEEISALLAPGGARWAAGRWVEAVYDHGKWDAAWSWMTQSFRLARIQAWLWNNRTNPYFEGADLDVEAADLDTMAEPLWAEFAAGELHLFGDVWHPSGLTGAWGVSARTRVIDGAHELVLFIETHGQPVVYDRAALIGSLPLLMAHDANGWLVANVGAKRPPVPGWPPDLG